MEEITRIRLRLLRAMYLLIGGGLAVYVWPLYFRSPEGVPHGYGVVRSILVAVSLLALLGVRYPLQMLPVLLLELLWKSLWVLGYGLPLWWAGRLDAAHAQTLFDTMLGVVLVPLVIPWRYVLARYVAAPAEGWAAVRNEAVIVRAPAAEAAAGSG